MMTFKASYMLVIFALLVLTLIPSNALESSAKTYWRAKVGNIPMPRILKDSLQSGSNVQLLLDTHPIIDESNLFFKWEIQVNNSQVPKDDRLVYFYDDTLSRVGEKIKLHFKKIDNEAKFLPSNVAKSMPATSNKLLEILNFLSVKPKSILAQDIEKMKKLCESKGVKDEKRYCAISLEGMVDYVTSILNTGKTKLMAISTQQGNGILMEYTIQKVQKLGSDDNRNLVCHKLSNPYAVFLCHRAKSMALYEVSLVGANGKQMKAVAICHKDTSSWNPNHYAFKCLKSKPGRKPICHFVSVDAISWFQI